MKYKIGDKYISTNGTCIEIVCVNHDVLTIIYPGDINSAKFDWHIASFRIVFMELTPLTKELFS